MKYKIITEYLDWYGVMNGDIVHYSKLDEMWLTSRQYPLFSKDAFENILKYHPDWVEQI
jgi:hypothetical protein